MAVPKLSKILDNVKLLHLDLILKHLRQHEKHYLEAKDLVARLIFLLKVVLTLTKTHPIIKLNLVFHELINYLLPLIHVQSTYLQDHTWVNVDFFTFLILKEYLIYDLQVFKVASPDTHHNFDVVLFFVKKFMDSESLKVVDSLRDMHLIDSV